MALSIQHLDSRRLLEASGVGHALVDDRGRVVAVSSILARALKLAESPSLLRLLRRLLPDVSERRRGFEALRHVLESGGEPVRLPAAHSDEAAIVVIGPCRDDRGGKGALVTLLRAPEHEAFVHQLKHYTESLERKILERSRALERSEERYRELFDASPDFYVTVDRRLRVEDVNRTALRETGYTPGEVVGRSILGLIPYRARRTLVFALPALDVYGRLENLEIEVLRRDGRTIDMIANAHAVRDEEERIAGARVVLRDVTRRNLLQQQLLESDRLATTGRLAAGVAHEVNNPLQSILTHMSLVGAAIPDDVEIIDSWRRIRESVKRIQSIVADLLDLRGSSRRGTSPADLATVVDESVAMAASPLRHRGIRLQVDVAEGLPPLPAFTAHLRQIVLNLVLHALEAMPRGGALSLRARRHAGSEYVILEVSHTGAALSPDRLSRLFDPTAAGEDDSSLGLFLTYGLVKDYGGSISVDHVRERTTFRVHLPCLTTPSVEQTGGAAP